jgi:hypothetical protein
MRRHAVYTIEQAISALRASGLDIIAIENGWILRELDSDGGYHELVCDSHRDLIDWARRQQALRLGLNKAISTYFARITSGTAHVRWRSRKFTHLCSSKVIHPAKILFLFQVGILSYRLWCPAQSHRSHVLSVSDKFRRLNTTTSRHPLMGPGGSVFVSIPGSILVSANAMFVELRPKR